MIVFTFIMLGVAFATLLLVTGMQPERPTLSKFELKRRAGDRKDDVELRRYEQYDNVATLLRLCGTLLLVIVILLCVVAWGWLLGVVVGVVTILVYGAAAHLSPVKALARVIYRRIEPHVLTVADRTSVILGLLRDYIPAPEYTSVSSREELIHVTEQSTNALSVDERRLVVHGLTFGNRLVSEVMTPRSVIDTVAHDELLGPLTLDDLYKKGHSRLPVVASDIDHIVGILYVQDLLVASAKKTSTVAEAMEKKVFYIREDQTLRHALSAFLKTHHHLFIVVNEYRETVGVLSLEDVIEALLGQEIVDEFDAHDDLRKVAERNPRDNNRPDERTDV